jgi:hypothetical protein
MSLKKLSAKMGYVTNERWNNMASFRKRGTT